MGGCTCWSLGFVALGGLKEILLCNLCGPLMFGKSAPKVDISLLYIP